MRRARGRFRGLAGVGNLPGAHQSRSRYGALSPSERAVRMDSAMPGMEDRRSVSWIAFQSASLTRTALPRFPVIVTGWESLLAWSMRLYRPARAAVVAGMVTRRFQVLSVRVCVRVRKMALSSSRRPRRAPVVSQVLIPRTPIPKIDRHEISHREPLPRSLSYNSKRYYSRFSIFFTNDIDTLIADRDNLSTLYPYTELLADLCLSYTKLPIADPNPEQVYYEYHA